MVGRDAAQGALSQALETAIAGRATTIAVVGEAGSGKTLLVQWVIERAAASFSVVAVRPVEGEVDLPLAVMVDVLRPLRPLLPLLSEEHREVLSAASGGVGRASADRLLLSAATLELFTSAAEVRPLLLVVDDAHWVDETSGQVLSFAIRRLLADRVCVVIARRPIESGLIPAAWQDVHLSGLSSADVEAMLFATSGTRPAFSVVERICHETFGNPLAVAHLGRTLSPDILSGQEPLPTILPLHEVAQRTFAGVVGALPAATIQALSVVATGGSAATEFALAGMRSLGLSESDLYPAESAGLVTASSGRLEFLHPLYRAAVLDVAGAVAVRRAHAALAEATRDRDLQRHAWHKGHSVMGADEDSARTLDAAADAAEVRVGAAATVGLRELAVALSQDGGRLAVRQVAAARALTAAGHHARARTHLEAILATTDAADEARAQAYSDLARLMLWDTPLDRQLVDEPIPQELTPRQRAATLAVASLRSRNAGQLDRFRDLARSAHLEATSSVEHAPSVTPEAEIAETLLLLPTMSLVAEAELVHGAHTAPIIHEAISRVRNLVSAAQGVDPIASEVSRGLAVMLDDLSGSPAQMLTWTPAVDLATDLLTLWLRSVKARPASIAYLLMARTELVGWTGDLLAGLSSAGRAIELSNEVGSHALTGWTHAFAARICAAKGDEPGCNVHGEQATSLGDRLAQPGLPIWSKHALGHVQLSTGRFAEAAETLKPVADFLGSIGLCSVRAIPWQPDQIEALARAGHPAEAEALLRSWFATMPPEPDPWHSAVLARCRVLVHGEETVDDLAGAISSGALQDTPLEEARAQLVCAAAMKRRRQPRASKAMLRAALFTFERLGARGWQTTTLAELGERRHLGVPFADDSVALTAQELRVAQEIVAGATYREAAARLFCSHKTIEYHISHVYAKLGIRSRRELAPRLPNIVHPAPM
jgi:DNA-binding CsgD family transcriptional regulator